MFTSLQPSVTGITICPGPIPEVFCYKEANHWHISLTNFMKMKSRQAYTEIAAYTDELLCWLARRRKQFMLMLHTLPFKGARMLVLDELCTGPEGGAYYRFYTRRAVARRLWVCDTSLLVLGDLPPRIFVKATSVNNRAGKR